METVDCIVALDPSTKCGFAIRDSEGDIESGVFEFPKSKSNTDGARLRRFQSWLSKINKGFKPSLVVYERMFIPHAKSRGGKLLIKIEGAIQTVFDDVDQEVVAPTSLKKYAVGRGQKVSKEEMVIAARKKWPDHLYNRKKIPDDEAEALLILSWAIDHLT